MLVRMTGTKALTSRLKLAQKSWLSKTSFLTLSS
uniref:Uncharacterized protein n=1 Tax=Anguilla anguilla TaxID=7936 RepID=A0A0E9R8I7_ANGAN